MQSNQLWSSEEKLCHSLLNRIPSPPLPSLLQIHAFLLRRSLLQTNLHLLTLLISSFSSSAAALRHARRLFDHRETQDAYLCNSMIHSLVQHRQFQESVQLYGELRRETSFSPDTYTFPFLLKSCALGEQREGIQIHTHVVKMGFCCHPFGFAGLVDMYAKFGDMGSAKKVFDGMPQRSPVSWTSMTVGYARVGDLGSAMELFRVMPVKDTAAFNAMIDVFVKAGDLGSARKLFDEMSDRNVVSWTSLVSGYSKVGDMESARVLFDEMPEKNIFSWNAMIGGYCKNNQPHKALELFRKLQSSSCPFNPDGVTVVSILPAIASMGTIDVGHWIHQYARRKGLDQHANVSTALMDMYFKCGDVQEARRVFDTITHKETASWNSMINGLALNGRANEALDVFLVMRRHGPTPNEVTMIGVLSACSHGRLVEEGKKWFQEMGSLGIERRIDHYGCMVDLLGRAGCLEEAERLIEEMPCKPNGIILSSLLFACGCYGDVGRAERVMGMAETIEPGNVRNYVILRNLYAEKKMWGDVERIKEVMWRFGGKKEAGCSVIEVGRKVWEFVSGDKVHPECEVICSVLGHLKFHMKGEGKWEIEMVS